MERYIWEKTLTDQHTMQIKKKKLPKQQCLREVNNQSQDVTAQWKRLEQSLILFCLQRASVTRL